jgi:hypothetical protein
MCRQKLAVVHCNSEAVYEVSEELTAFLLHDRRQYLSLEDGGNVCSLKCYHFQGYMVS